MLLVACLLWACQTPAARVRSNHMKTKLPVVILILACLGLGVALVMRHNKAVVQKEQDEARIMQLSNEWTQASAKLAAQVEVSAGLTNTLQTKSSELEKAAQQLGEVKASLQKSEAEAKATAQTVKEKEAELAKRDAKITELEGQNQLLDKQALDLKTAIGGLETKITETQRKLVNSEGEREFLLKELKRMQAEKAELERQFNDLVVLREQVRKLKDELAISRRLDWIKKGLYGLGSAKGAMRLQQGFGQATPGTNYNLNVEIKRDGSAPVITPAPAPAPTAPPK